MKKKTLLALGLVALVLFSCNKATESSGGNQLPEHYARMAADSNKESNYPIEITIRLRVGHNASECDHSCYTTMANQNMHVNC